MCFSALIFLMPEVKKWHQHLPAPLYQVEKNAGIIF